MRVIGERIYQARLAADMSRADLAVAIRRLTSDRIKANERGVRRWEKEERNIQPSAAAVAAIAAATGKSIAYFYVPTDDSSEPVTRDQKLRNVGLAVEALIGAQV